MRAALHEISGFDNADLPYTSLSSHTDSKVEIRKTTRHIGVESPGPERRSPAKARYHVVWEQHCTRLAVVQMSLRFEKKKRKTAVDRLTHAKVIWFFCYYGAHTGRPAIRTLVLVNEVARKEREATVNAASNARHTTFGQFELEQSRISERFSRAECRQERNSYTRVFLKSTVRACTKL
jgi:hypothetical protein